MKAISSVGNAIATGASVLFALAVLSAPSSVKAADPMRGGEHLLHLQGIKTKAEAEALKPGDTVAMVCSKCKAIMIHKVTTEKGHIQLMTEGEKHLCPGCNSTITTVGVGKGAKNEVKHVCDKCGSDSVFCCATKPGSGATEGMEKK